jgi:lipoprotein-releasing system ATP-binding protein
MTLMVATSMAPAGRPVDEVLELVGLDGKAERMPHELSGGEQQRVAIARAFANRPMVLLADEPTGNLDSKSADSVFALLRQFNREQGTTVLFVTHNAALAQRCDKTIQVIDGQVA